MTLQADDRLGRNALFTAISKGIEAGASLIATLLVARYLAPKGYGIYAQIVSSVMMLWPLVDMGLDHILVREMVSRRDPPLKLIGTGLSIRLVAGVLTSIILLFWLFLTNARGELVTASFLAALNILFFRQGSNLICRALFLGLERVENDVAATAVGQGFRLAGLFVVIHLDLGLHAVLAVPIGAEISQIVVGLLLARGVIGPANLQASLSLAFHLIKESWTILLRLVLVTAYFHVDAVILGRLLSSEEVGLFAAPFRLITGLVVVAVPTMWALLPSLSRAEGSKRREHMMKRIGPVAAAATAAIGLVVAVFAGHIVMVFGEAYKAESSILCLRLLSLLPVLHTISYIMELELLAKGRQELALAGAGPALLLKIGADIVLAGIVGPAAGAVSSVSADVLRTAVLARMVRSGWIGRAMVPVLILAGVIGVLIVRSGVIG